MLPSLGFVFLVSLLILATVTGWNLWHPQRYRQSVFVLTSSYSLPYSPAVIYAELYDLSKWWQWHGQVSPFCQVTQPAGIGQVLFSHSEAPFNSLEIVQAWQDRRLRLISQSLADAATGWEEFELLAEGAFCLLKWNVRVEISRSVSFSLSQRRRLEKARQEMVFRFLEHLDSAQH